MQTFCSDAAGTVVFMKKQTKREGQTVLYYSLVIQHSIRANNPPVAVSKYITSDQSSLSIAHFLECFHKAEEKLYGILVHPVKIVIGCSPTLLKSWNQTV